MIDSSIYQLLAIEKQGITQNRIADLVDWLNEQVVEERIVLDGNVWVCPEYEKQRDVSSIG